MGVTTERVAVAADTNYTTHIDREKKMYASIRKYKTKPGGVSEVSRLTNEGFLPIISKAPGFVAYYVVDGGNDVVASISIFQDQSGLEESNRMAANWVKENTASLALGTPEITAGAVTVKKTA